MLADYEIFNLVSVLIKTRKFRSTKEKYNESFVVEDIKSVSVSMFEKQIILKILLGNRETIQTASQDLSMNELEAIQAFEARKLLGATS